MFIKTLFIVSAIMGANAQVRQEYNGNINYEINNIQNNESITQPIPIQSEKGVMNNQLKNIDQQIGMLNNYIRFIDVGFSNNIILISEINENQIQINLFENNTYDSIIGFIESIGYPVNWNEIANNIPIIDNNENNIIRNNDTVTIRIIKSDDSNYDTVFNKNGMGNFEKIPDNIANSYDFKLRLLNFLMNNKISFNRYRDIMSRFSSIENIKSRIIMLMKSKINRLR